MLRASDFIVKMPGVVEGDFEQRAKFQTPEYPLWCMSCNVWHTNAYFIDYGRRNNKLFFEAWELDESNEVALVGSWYEREGDEAFVTFQSRYFGRKYLDLYASAWALYYDWMLENQLSDPLQAFETPPTRPMVSAAYIRTLNNVRLTQHAVVH